VSSAIVHSALYSGWVQHRRFAPRAHAFSYRMGLLYLDLAEQDAVLGLSPLSGRARFAAFSFRERDYLPQYTSQGITLADAVRQRVSEALGRPVTGAVRLLTQPRSWGLCFNPVSFFYCFDEQEQLTAVLCEVSNTPWHERYHYVLPASGNRNLRCTVAKTFHVSPFLPGELEYRMRFNPPGRRIGVHMEDWQGEQKLFDATLGLQRQALTSGAVHRYLLSFPWMTTKTLLAIYWQALRLLLKRAPIFTHQPATTAYGLAVTQPTGARHEEP